MTIQEAYAQLPADAAPGEIELSHVAYKTPQGMQEIFFIRNRSFSISGDSWENCLAELRNTRVAKAAKELESLKAGLSTKEVQDLKAILDKS